MSLENWILILQIHSCLVEPSTARHEALRGDSGFAEANAGLQPAVVLKPDRDNETSVIRGPAIRKAGWLNSNGAVKHTAACEKSYISGGIRKSTEKPYFQKVLPGAVSGWYLAGFIHISVWRLEKTANKRKLVLSARWLISCQSRCSGWIKAGRCSSCCGSSERCRQLLCADDHDRSADIENWEEAKAANAFLPL